MNKKQSHNQNIYNFNKKTFLLVQQRNFNSTTTTVSSCLWRHQKISIQQIPLPLHVYWRHNKKNFYLLGRKKFMTSRKVLFYKLKKKNFSQHQKNSKAQQKISISKIKSSQRILYSTKTHKIRILLHIQ